MQDIAVTIGYGRRPGQFRVQVVESPVRDAFADVDLDVDALLAMRDPLMKVVLLSSVPTRYNPSADERLVQDVGRTLFTALLGTGEVHACYRSSADFASQRDERLRIALRIDTPELAALPWEAMYDEQGGGYVCREHEFVRQVPMGTSTSLLDVRRPLRILGVTSAPSDLSPLDESAEREQLARALSEHERDGLVEVAWARSATWIEIQERLMDGPWHMIHFIGHGDFDPERYEGRLALTGEDGLADWVGASRFADLVRQATPMPRLIVLNSCQGATSGTSDPFSGTAAALARNRVTAVAAMQYPVSNAAAVAFAGGFYAALARGHGADEAVSAGRRRILGLSGKTLEWVSPVLYVRGNQTQLFALSGDMSALPAAATPEAQPEHSARPNGAAQGRGDGNGRESATSEPSLVLKDHTTAVRYVAYGPGGALLASVGTDNTIRLWDGGTGELRQVLKIDCAGTALPRLVFGLDGKLLVAAGPDGKLRSWDTTTGELDMPLASFGSNITERVRRAVFSPDGNMMAVATDGDAVLLDADSHRERRWLSHVRAVEDLAFSPDGTLLATVLDNGEVQLWDVEKGDPLWTLYPASPSLVTALAQPSKKRLGGPIFNRTRAPGRRGHGVYGKVRDLAFDRRGMIIAAAYEDGGVSIWSTRTFREEHSIWIGSGAVRQLALGPDGDRLAVIGPDETFHLLTRGDPAAQPALDADPAFQPIFSAPVSTGSEVALSSDGRLIAAVEPDGDTYIRDTRTAAPVRVLPGDGHPVRWVAISPDGERVATAGVDKTVRIWSL